MALRQMFTKRLVNKSYGYRLSSPAVSLEHSPSTDSIVPPNAVKTNFHREYIPSPETAEKSLFRRFLQRRAINQSATRFPELFSVPVGDKLREKLKNINIAGDRLRLGGLAPSVQNPVTASDSLHGLTVHDARKLLRLSQVEKLKLKLREIPKTSIPYNEFIQICVDGCKNEDQGVEFAKLLDQSGNVIVLGNMVLLRPEQVAKSLETIFSESIGTPNDPRRKELEQMEQQKAIIDKKAGALVRGEMYCGLGFLMLQMVGFMRLTFWEFSWDVMEPICFFVASLHFAIGYGFFLRTSIEPTFEGYFQRRFKTKQKKLMKTHEFDEERYNKLRKLFCPQGFPDLHHFKSIKHEEGRTSWGFVQ